MKDCHFSQYVLFVLTNVVIFLKIQCVIILVFYFKRFTLSYVYECLPACINVYHVCAWCLQRPEEVVEPLGT